VIAGQSLSFIIAWLADYCSSYPLDRSSRFCDHQIMRKLIMCLSISLLVATGCSSVGVRGNRIPAAASGIQQLVYYSPVARKYFMAIVPGFKAGTQSNEKVLMVKTLDPQNKSLSRGWPASMTASSRLIFRPFTCRSREIKFPQYQIHPISLTPKNFW